MKKENMVMENNQEMSMEELEQVNGGYGEILGATLVIGATVAIGAAVVAGAAIGATASALAESNESNARPEPQRCGRRPEFEDYRHEHRHGHDCHQGPRPRHYC